MQQVKTKLTVKGMFCTSCSSRIEKALEKLEGVTNVSASYNSGTVVVSHDARIACTDDIIRTIEQLGYTAQTQQSSITVGHEENKESGRNKAAAIVLGIAIIAFAVFFMFNNTLGLNFLPEINASMGFGLLFVVGLLTSVHCISMCGGINLSQCIAHQTDAPQTLKTKMRPSLLYNLGRVISYTIIGGIVGALGSVISFSGTAKGIIAIAAGVFMVIMGLNLTGLFPWMRKLIPRMPKVFSKRTGKKRRGPFIVGLLNGLMPCGPLQAMQIYALGTGSFFTGALSMLIFSLGTVPLMFGFGAISSLLSGKFTKRLMKISAILVIALGVVMMGRGLAQSGLSPALATDNTPSNVAKIEGDVQIVSTQMKGNVYDPITVQAGIPVKWTITADEDELNGCNNPVTIPRYYVEKKLVPGENVIEFTPTQEGSIVYTCWMGMISGSIHVVSDVGNTDSVAAVQPAETGSQAPASGGCCGTGSYAPGFENGRFPVDKVAIAKIVDGVQTVSITVNENGFDPALVVMQKDVETYWVINGENLSGCTNSLIFPAYNAQKDLVEGENVIKFTPEADFSYSCWMGMLNGYVKVVDDITKINLGEIQQEAAGYKSPLGGGCCG